MNYLDLEIELARTSEREYNIYNLFDKYKKIYLIEEYNDLYSIVFFYKCEDRNIKYYIQSYNGIYDFKNDKILRLTESIFTINKKTISDKLYRFIEYKLNTERNSKYTIECTNNKINKEKLKNKILRSIENF